MSRTAAVRAADAIEAELADAGTPERAARLALLPPLRRGAGDFERFARYADGMLDEREFFIRKAIGWVLRKAVKYLPEADRDALLASRQDRHGSRTVFVHHDTASGNPGRR